MFMQININPDKIGYPRENTEESANEWDINLTIDPCIISLNDNPDSLRCAMPCGHAITPNCLIAYVFNELKRGKFFIACPWKDPNNTENKCEYEWNYLDIQKNCMLSGEEKIYYEYMTSANKVKSESNVIECTNCHHFIKLLGDSTNNKVICRNCVLRKVLNPSFCKACGKSWFQTRSKDKCGNVGCPVDDETAFGVEMRKCAEFEVRKIQRCPQCSIPIEHIGPGYCNSMTCPCGWKFCWVSLKGDWKDNWSGANTYIKDVRNEMKAQKLQHMQEKKEVEGKDFEIANNKNKI